VYDSASLESKVMLPSEDDVQFTSVVSLKRLNNKATRVIPAKAGIQKVRTVDSVSSTE
jgi:hypothetical protein